ncbi:unnamed protein product [Prunus armeniaca]|uniref:Legume lectin domain-containing protein n=1 Tax=Prunus armeniaca TaxID=36596 RepID=A0A6J5X9S4_PRUAR|nr:unnamed protein product [Prunus armeniaca]
MVANYNSATAILRLHPQKLYHLLLLLLLLLTPCATPLTFHFPTFQNSHRLFTEGDAVIDNQYVHLNKENLRAESSTGSVGRAMFCEPFLLRENATGKLADFTTNFAFIIDGKNRTSHQRCELLLLLLQDLFQVRLLVLVLKEGKLMTLALIISPIAQRSLNLSNKFSSISSG